MSGGIEVGDGKIILPVQMIGLPARYIDRRVVGFNGNRGIQIGDGVLAQAATLVATIEGIGDQALDDVFGATALAGDELIRRAEVSGIQCLAEQGHGFVPPCLSRRRR
ncbi:MAG: hypothetical protein WDN48_16685 [Pseudolabrys sp.]